MDEQTLSHHINIIKRDCSIFLEESGEIPLYKALPSTYQDVQKVKVRLKKEVDEVSSYFNKAFEPSVPMLRQRAVFAYPSPTAYTADLDLFYVFPINSYKFLYSTEVTNSSKDYQHVMDTLFEMFHDNNKVIDIVTDLLKYTYSTSNLYWGLYSTAEIIFYGIPYYYVIRASVLPDYKHLFH
jgi:hypothetical protein